MKSVFSFKFKSIKNPNNAFVLTVFVSRGFFGSMPWTGKLLGVSNYWEYVEVALCN